MNANGRALTGLLLGGVLASVAGVSGAAGVSPPRSGTSNLPVAAARQGSSPPAGARIWTSSNWSGYALGTNKTPAGTYTSISGTWKVPVVKKNSGTRSSSQWIGIDGALNSRLIQTGTYVDYTKGVASYGVWWEILPSSGKTIHKPVLPGQTITASIVENQATKRWTITISNGVWTFVKKTRYTGKCQSAEWIVEAPLIGSSDAQLTHTARVTFDNLTVNGADPMLPADDAGRMRQGGKIREMPSLPSAAGDAFSMQYGSKAPPAPKD